MLKPNFIHNTEKDIDKKYYANNIKRHKSITRFFDIALFNYSYISTPRYKTLLKHFLLRFFEFINYFLKRLFSFKIYIYIYIK